jgi:tRNA G18 (ribose-2'-O)-methylase SpoU
MRDVIHVADVRDARLSDYSAIDPRIPRRDVERAAVSGGYAICEGPLLVRRTLETDARVRSVLVTPSRLRKLADILDGVDAPIYVAEKAVLEEVVGYAFHRGAVASVERPVQRPLAALLEGARRIAVCEGITDHENLGSIFRNAAAFGLDAVLLDPTTCDPLYRRSIRVSMGHALRVPWARVEPWPDGLDRLRELGFTCVALTPGADSIVLDEIDRSVPIAFMLGTEGPGLTAAALGRADVRVRIPMAPGVDSLNVAATSALAFRAIADDGLV